MKNGMKNCLQNFILPLSNQLQLVKLSVNFEMYMFPLTLMAISRNNGPNLKDKSLSAGSTTVTKQIHCMYFSFSLYKINKMSSTEKPNYIKSMGNYI